MNDVTTPYALIFRDTGITEEYFPRIREQLPEDGARRERDAFFTAPAVGDLLAAIAPETGAGATQIGLLTFHAFHHWRTGARTWTLEEEELRSLLAGGPLGGWKVEPPAEAGYFQLPRHRFWVASDPQTPAQPVDGFFWVAAQGGREWSPELLLVLGMHGGQGGVSVVELASSPLPPDGHWGDVDGRGDGEDFANVLPGGEHLLGLRTAGEALKLVSRIFWHVRSHGSVRDSAGSGGDQ